MSKLARSLFGSSRLQEGILALMAEVREAQKAVTGIKPPSADLEENYKTYLGTLNTLRGRNLYYPYVGSGLGQGPYVELGDGSVKIDLINGIGIQLFGHSHPEIIETCIR